MLNDIKFWCDDWQIIDGQTHGKLVAKQKFFQNIESMFSVAISSFITTIFIHFIFVFRRLFFDVEFNVKCSNLIDCHVIQIACDTFDPPHRISIRNAIHCRPFLANMLVSIWYNLDGDVHATNEINSLIAVLSGC